MCTIIGSSKRDCVLIILLYLGGSKLSKIIWDQKTADIVYYLIDPGVISFFMASKGKKFQAIYENSQSRRSKNSYLLRGEWLNEFH